MKPRKAPYQGQIKNKLRHGYGTYVYPGGFFKYQGDWVAGEKHGKGIFEMGDGSSYDGDFVHGEMTGIGLRRWPNGSSYNGSFKNGEMNGEGIYISSNGEKYDGSFENNQRHGEGELTAEGKYVYVGGFKNHKKHGHGKMSNQESVAYEYEGGFQMGMRCGDGVYTDKNGNTYEGQWAKNLRNGQGAEVNAASGVSYSGLFADNVPTQVPTRFRMSRIPPEPVEGEEGELEPPADEDEEPVDPTKIPAVLNMKAGDEFPTFQIELVKLPDLPPPAPLDERLRAFYTKFVPEKASDPAGLEKKVASLVKVYSENEAELNQKLMSTYEVDLSELDKPDEPVPPPVEEEPEEDTKKKKGKDKKKKGKKDDDEDEKPPEPEFNEEEWSIVTWESGRLLQCQLWQIIPPEEEPEEGKPPPEPERRLQPLLIPEPQPEPVEGEGGGEGEAAEGDESAVEGKEGEAEEVEGEGKEAEAAEAPVEGEEGENDLDKAEEKPMQTVDLIQVRSEDGMAVIAPSTVPIEALGGEYELVISDVTEGGLLQVPLAKVNVKLLGFGEEEDTKGKKKKKK